MNSSIDTSVVEESKPASTKKQKKKVAVAGNATETEKKATPERVSRIYELVVYLFLRSASNLCLQTCGEVVRMRLFAKMGS